MEEHPTNSAEIVLPARDLGETLAFFTEQLGFRLEEIFPADDPATALITGNGIRLRLDRAADGPPGTLRLAGPHPGDQDEPLEAPNGTQIEFFEPALSLSVPPLVPAFVATRGLGKQSWVDGRAGMLYRDLIPGRLGGHLIASHIRIPDGGPVPDQVHFHRIRFQMIYCRSGWVRVVYQDQGPPFVLEAGDCVLQPPEIRHRVLESSAGCEVIEIACPAAHVTCMDHDLTLPSDLLDPERAYAGQRFVRHRAQSADWHLWDDGNFEARDSGIAAATGQLADAKVIRSLRSSEHSPWRREDRVQFLFVLQGEITLAVEGLDRRRLRPGDAITLPPNLEHRFAEASDDLEILSVALRP